MDHTPQKRQRYNKTQRYRGQYQEDRGSGPRLFLYRYQQQSSSLAGRGDRLTARFYQG